MTWIGNPAYGLFHNAADGSQNCYRPSCRFANLSTDLENAHVGDGLADRGVSDNRY